MSLSRSLAFAVLFGTAGCGGGAETRGDRDDRPNVLIFIADDLGWNDVGFHGSEIRTPRLDALARESVLLDQFYVYPTCSPTRAMLLTGRNPSRFGILGPIDPTSRDSKDPLPLEAVTLAELLAGAGYQTAQVGKWHLGSSFEFGPRRQGFQIAAGYLHGQLDQYTHQSKELGPNWFREERFVDEPGHATDLIARDAIDFLRRPRRAPFFLYVGWSVPHYPLQEDEKWVNLYEGTIAHPDRRLVAGMVTHMDDALGRVLDALDELKIRERTLVFFLSDNGGQKDWLKQGYGGAHGPYQRLGDNRPLRGWKGETYEGGIRVVAMAHWRGALAPRLVTDVTSALDVLPTVARLAGAKVSPALRLEGGDLWPLLSGAGRRDAPTLYWNIGSQAALRVGDWKLIEARLTGALQLFNLRADPLETSDLAAQQPERAQALRQQLVEIKARDPRP